MGFDRVHLEGHAWNVITAILIKGNGITPLHLIYDNIAHFSEYLSGFLCSHAHRSGKSVSYLADICNMVLHHEKNCTASFPPSIQALADISHISICDAKCHITPFSKTLTCLMDKTLSILAFSYSMYSCIFKLN